MKIKSTYRDKKDNFTMTVISEDDENYYVRLDKEWQDKFQEGDKVTPLRKSLIGKLYQIEEIEQLSLFW